MTHHKRYLAPADVAPEHAGQVLDALNAIRSARQLADAVDVPGEPDIGVRLAQRILDRRDELGGFADLQQIFDVPLIGPERFTELVVSLSDAPWPDRPPTPHELLRQEVAALRHRVDALGTLEAGRRITLRPVQTQPFLGQTITLIATVTDGGTRPAIDVPVTLLATRGQLSASDGYTTTHGHLITARTGIDGRLRVTLALPTTEQLSARQHAALATAIEGLPVGANTPQQAGAALRELARQYAWEINLPLRQAVDIYARDFAPALLDSVAPQDPLEAWRQVECGLLAFAPLASGNGDEPGSSVAATATLNLGFRDWILPFLAAAVELHREENRLHDRLRAATANEQDSSALVGAVYSWAGDYIAAQRGMLGAYIGRKVAETSVRDFVNRELAPELPLETRAAVLPALTAASRTIATTDANVLQGLVRTRTELKADLDTRTGRDTGSLADFGGRLGMLETAVSAFPERLGAIEQNAVTRQQLDAALSDRVTTQQFEAALSDRVTTQQFEAALRDRVTTQQFEAALRDRVTAQQFEAALRDRVTAQQFEAALRDRVTAQQLNTALASKADVRMVDERFTTLDRSVTDLRGRLG